MAPNNTIMQRPAISRSLKYSADICQQFKFAVIDVPIFFMGLHHSDRNGMDRFINDLGLSPNSVYQAIATSLNLFPRVSHRVDNLPLSDSLVSALNVVPTIEQNLRQSTYENGALIVALIITPGPLHDIFMRFGVTTNKLQSFLLSAQTPTHTTESHDPRRHHTPIQKPDCPTIQANCIDLMEKALRGEIKPVIGRDEEIKRIIQILSLYTKNNPVLVGEAGTGKTAIVEGLAVQLIKGDVPAELADLYIYQLDPSSINGEDTLRSIIEEAKSEPRIVLFIDEIHTLIGRGSYSNNSFANILKPEMARGTIKILGATTHDEYTQHIEKDKAFERRFQKVQIDEPSIESSIIILTGIKNRFEQHHNVKISQEAIESAVKLSYRFITDRRLPDKAIDLLDEASSNVHLKGVSSLVSDKDIMEVVTRRTGIPMQNLTPDDMTQLKNIEATLHNSVVGQEKAIRAVANAIRRSRMGLGDESRPIGSFLFLGTSGVGKTELCKALAEMLFHSRDAMVRIDMSEYQLEHSVARLFGAPPGYVGYEQGGQLTEAVRHKPYSVVLFDEMEKAHPKVFETLLQVLDDGRMTDGQGRTINFRNTIIVMTSNMGQNIIARNLTGSNVTDYDIERTTNEVVALLKQRAAPEFWGRVDNVVMFLPLTREEVLQITRMQLKASQNRMANQGISLSYDASIAEFIASNSYQPEYGARQVKKVINRLIVDNIATSLAEGRITKNQPIICSLVGGKIVCNNR